MGFELIQLEISVEHLVWNSCGVGNVAVLNWV